MLSSRQLNILTLIIQQFTSLGKAVGSKTLMENGIQASSATIRNDMAKLEHFGFIAKEHTSSGRVPTTEGYRYYVHHLIEPEKISLHLEQMMQENFQQPFSQVGEVVKSSVDLLSRMTNFTIVATSPEVMNRRLVAVNPFRVSHRQMLLNVIIDDGSVFHKMIYLTTDLTETGMVQLIRLIEERLVGHRLRDIHLKMKMELPMTMNQYFSQPAFYLQLLKELLAESFKRTVYVSGRMNLLQLADVVESSDLLDLIRLFSDDTQLAKLIHQSNDAMNIQIDIGDEQAHILLQELTLIKIPYEIKGHGKGNFALFGPTNMEYEKVVSILETFRRQFVNCMTEYYRYLDTL